MQKRIVEKKLSKNIKKINIIPFIIIISFIIEKIKSLSFPIKNRVNIPRKKEIDNTKDKVKCNKS